MSEARLTVFPNETRSTLVVLPQRNPLVLAKQVASLDSLSKGRVELGVGVGWLREEFDALGVPFERRGVRADEYIEAMRELWAHDDASYEGEHVAFTGVNCSPRPALGTVPIIVGGHSERAARRAGRLGDGFFPATGSPVELAPLFDLARRTAADHGRDPDGISLMTGCPGALGDDPVGAVTELAEAGIDRVVVPTSAFLPDLDEALGRFGETVIAEVGQ